MTKRPGVKNHPLLGKVPDICIAEELGVTPAAVCRARKMAGIPRFSKDGEDVKGAGYIWDNPEIEAMLGTLPDTVLARKLGLTQGSVWSARTRRGISRSKDDARKTRHQEWKLNTS